MCYLSSVDTSSHSQGSSPPSNKTSSSGWACWLLVGEIDRVTVQCDGGFRRTVGHRGVGSDHRPERRDTYTRTPRTRMPDNLLRFLNTYPECTPKSQCHKTQKRQMWAERCQGEAPFVKRSKPVGCLQLWDVFGDTNSLRMYRPVRTLGVPCHLPTKLQWKRSHRPDSETHVK
jgi:hypothetical protein